MFDKVTWTTDIFESKKEAAHVPFRSKVKSSDYIYTGWGVRVCVIGQTCKIKERDNKEKKIKDEDED